MRTGPSSCVSWAAALLTTLGFALVSTGCKSGTRAVYRLKDVPPAALQQGWQPMLRNDLSFTIALPPGAQIMEIPKELLEGGGSPSGLDSVLARASGGKSDGN